MNFGIQYRTYSFQFPFQKEPTWSSRVERWYQLDAYSFGLAQAYIHWGISKTEHPDMIVLASPKASNETDRRFVQSGGTSPARFVHTLPNVRSSSLCQVMEWGGPLLCLQNDPSTLVSGLAQSLSLSLYREHIWVLTVRKSHLGNQFEVDLFDIIKNQNNPKLMYFEVFKHLGHDDQTRTDEEFLLWLRSSKPDSTSFKLPNHWEIHRRLRPRVNALLDEKKSTPSERNPI